MCRPSAAWMRRWPRRRTSLSRATFGSPPSWPATPCSPSRTMTLHGTARHRPGAAGLRGGERDLAQQLPHRRAGTAGQGHRAHRTQQRGLAPALTITQLFDSIAIRINAPKPGRAAVHRWHFTMPTRTTGWNSATRPHPLPHPRQPCGRPDGHPDQAQLLQLLATAQPAGIGTSGDATVLQRLMSLLDKPRPDFAIVTP